ncbi:GPI mannosyltransferase [Paraphysoderma sedebokerense]|nr:GPI mannosyltransferase [Paraphysoderma sedebokerense]
MFSLSTTLAMSFFIRLAFLLYGEYQDANFTLKYTDIDYSVFSDAAHYVYNQSSPYSRSTYRYTPLLSFLLIPNITIHKSFGKYIFILSDILIGYLIYRIHLTRKLDANKALKSSLLWLWNPFVMNISSRGNAESVLGVLVILCFYLILKKRLVLGSMVFGLAVHFKIYPVVYAAPLLVLLNDDYMGTGEKSDESGRKGSPKKEFTIYSSIVGFLNRQRLTLGFVSASTFMILNAFMYRFYGYEFLHETYLYHLTRQDHRHNFSIYFYHLYLTFNSSKGAISSLLSFLPQFILVFAVGFCFGKDLFFAAFLQTFVFVAFNKVCTSQYFMWYLFLYPLITPYLHISSRGKSVALLLAWVSSQGLWLYNAYNLEFKNQATFQQLWMSSILFFSVHIWMIVELVRGYQLTGVFKDGLVTSGAWTAKTKTK